MERLRIDWHFRHVAEYRCNDGSTSLFLLTDVPESAVEAAEVAMETDGHFVAPFDGFLCCHCPRYGGARFSIYFRQQQVITAAAAWLQDGAENVWHRLMVTLTDHNPFAVGSGMLPVRCDELPFLASIELPHLATLDIDQQRQAKLLARAITAFLLAPVREGGDGELFTSAAGLRSLPQANEPAIIVCSTYAAATRRF